jgi:hypothetical protein
VKVDTSSGFGPISAFLAGGLGVAAALIYHVRHLDTIRHAA